MPSDGIQDGGCLLSLQSFFVVFLLFNYDIVILILWQFEVEESNVKSYDLYYNLEDINIILIF